MKRMIAMGCLLAASLLAGAEGCSSSSSGGGGTGSSSGGSGGGGVGEHDSKKITAAAGGTVTGTGVSVNIPAGALAADTTITIDIKDKAGYANASNIATNVYELGPNKTTFSKPVPLTLDLGSAKAPTGMTPVIAYYDGSAWQTLTDSALSGTKVTATTTHFTPFTIVWTNGMQTGGGCGPLEFTPCGGSLVGTWSFTAGCYNVAAGAGDPTGGKCPQATTSATVDLSGTVTFNADGTQSSSTTEGVTFAIDIPAACLTANGIPNCAALAGDGGSGTVVDDGMGGCKWTQVQAPKSSTDTGTYQTSGTTFTTSHADGGGTNAAIDYCVSGTTLKAKQLDTKGNEIIYVATKQ